MNEEPRRASSDRMIHIRLDEKTHRQIKIQAAQDGKTIQRLVEEVIQEKIIKLKKRSSN